MRVSTLAVLSCACLVAGVALVLRRQTDPLPVAPNVDLSRYQGRWFEIARLPARFERECAADVTADYTLRNDGTIQVVNACGRTGGGMKRAEAIAKLKNAGGPTSKLKVRFFWPFYGDYWILDLDSQYRWALVGTPDRRYLWILSRTPQLDTPVYERLLAKAGELGFNVSRVIRTAQNTWAG